MSSIKLPVLIPRVNIILIKILARVFGRKQVDCTVHVENSKDLEQHKHDPISRLTIKYGNWESMVSVEDRQKNKKKNGIE